MASSNKGPRPTNTGARPTTTPNGTKPKTSATPSRPVAANSAKTSATASKPLVAKEVVARRAPITTNATTRQTRLALQQQRQRTQNGITAAFLAVLVVVAALIVWNVIPHNAAAAKAKACLTPPKGQPSAAAAPPATTVKPVTLAGGIESYDFVVGCGDAIADSGATVTVNYTGWVQGGAKFDSSVDRGQPAQFALNQVIKGWTQGMIGMKIGGVRRLVIPGALAYGANPPSGSNIPPNATLIFDISLISIP